MNKREFLKKISIGTIGLSTLNETIFAFVDNFLPKPVREAMHYIHTARGIRCQICPNECDIKPGETGDCRTRVIKNDKLYTSAYGNPCAIHVDPIEKKPLNHFLPQSKAFSIATAGCNLACLNCQNWTISQKAPDETKNYNLPPEEVVKQAQKYQCASIAYTYSEPIVYYEYPLDTAKNARSQGIKNVFVSAGYINEKPLREISKYLDAANIDLKSFSDDIYARLNAGKLEPILRTLKILKDEGVWLEITNLIIPTWTDDFKMIEKMCNWLKTSGFEQTPLHFSRFHPMYKLTKLPATPVATLVKAREIALNAGLNYVYIGNVPGSKAQNTYCPSCKHLVIERKGYHILQNNLKSGKCANCGTKIAGVWE